MIISFTLLCTAILCQLFISNSNIMHTFCFIYIKYINHFLGIIWHFPLLTYGTSLSYNILCSSFINTSHIVANNNPRDLQLMTSIALVMTFVHILMCYLEQNNLSLTGADFMEVSTWSHLTRAGNGFLLSDGAMPVKTLILQLSWCPRDHLEVISFPKVLSQIMFWNDLCDFCFLNDGWSLW